MARDINPPYDRPVEERLRPDHTVASFSELVSRTSPRYQANHPVKRGTLYSSLTGSDVRISSSYPALYFLREVVPVGFSDLRGMPGDQQVIWYWSTDEFAENSYNASISYLSESVSHPVYARISMIRRKDYEATPTIATGTAFTGLISVNITAGGSGYATATGTIATGATVEFVIAGGVIIGGIVTNEGSSVSSGGSITITGDGTGATAVARIQPATAVLVAQKKEELNDSDPLALEFVRVTKVYSTLPGPILSAQEYDQTWDIVIPRTEQIVAAGTSLGTNRVEIQKIDSVQQNNITFDPTVLATVFGAYSNTYPGVANLQFPDVLTSLTGYMNIAGGTGTDTTGGSGSGTGTTFYLQWSSRGRKQTSYSITPELVVEIKQYWARNVPTINYFFLLPSPVNVGMILGKLASLIGTPATVTITIASPGVVTWTAHGLNNGDTVTFTTTGALPTGLSQWNRYYVINKTTNTFQVSLTSGGSAINTSGSQSGVHSGYSITVNSWPKYIPQSHTFILQGQKGSVETTTQSGASESSNDDGESSSETHGGGTAHDLSTSMRAVRTPPCIHGALSIGGTTSDTSGGLVAFIKAPDGTTSLSATTPASIPSTGLYLLPTSVVPYRFGWAKCAVEVVNFADVA